MTFLHKSLASKASIPATLSGPVFLLLRGVLSAGSCNEQWLPIELKSCIILIEAVSHATICAICRLSIIANPRARNYPPIFLTKRYRRDENWPTHLTSVAVQPIYVFLCVSFRATSVLNPLFPKPSYGEMFCHPSFCICGRNPVVFPFK